MFEKDTLFFNSQKALEIALKMNEVETIPGHPVKALQICYYIGNKLIEKNIPKNCIHIDLENLYNYFVTTKNRLPELINFESNELSLSESKILADKINDILKIVAEEKNELIILYTNLIIKQSPDFNDVKWRIFIPTIRESTVIKNVSKNIAIAFEKKGYDVLFYLPDELESQYPLAKYHYMYEFNPHIVITIDFLENVVINKNSFLFCWFQDPMPILTDKNIPLNFRDRDFFFSLFKKYDENLIKKNVPENKIIRQHFCTNNEIFHEKKDIERENKVVFIGRSYDTHLRHYHNELEVIKELTKMVQNASINKLRIKKITKKYLFDYDYTIEWILPYIIRKELVLWICNQDKLKVEVYGSGWENYPSIMKCYKGEINYGEDLANIYNSAKYSLAGDLNYFYQQRLLEMSACGTIPLLYYPKLEDNEDFIHHKNVLFFKTKEELVNNLNKEPINTPLQIANDISFNSMINKINDIVCHKIKE